jgi:alpha,alpha-trehalase
MWTLEYTKFVPGEEGLREALCTLGNGYFATRGAGEETRADDVHYPGTYIAGGFNRMKTEIAGRMVENEDFVNFPNWLPLNFRHENGEWFDLRNVEIQSFRQSLHLREGYLERHITFQEKDGRITTLTTRRFIHIREQHLAAIQMTIRPENWSGKIQIRSAIDGTVTNSGVKRYGELRGDHLRALDGGAVDNEGIWLRVETKQSRIRMAQAARTCVYRNGSKIEAHRDLLEENGYIAHRIDIDAVEKQELTVEKIVALYTSRDKAITESGLEARNAIRDAGTFGELFETHKKRWAYYWDRTDSTFEADGGRMQLILRLHIFHIIQTTSMNTIDLDFGIPARGLHGEAYRGHIFWDELFIIPFFNYRLPEITRSLLLYRYRRLGKARRAARKENLRGALFPWQSGSNGREETQEVHLNPKSGQWDPDHTHLQRHVNAAIAYNIWHYFTVTGDLEFMCAYGAEMLLEIARLWDSLTSYNEDLKRYEIKGVIGPDEYHEGYPDRETPGLDNNTYTNVMAVWCMCRAIETLRLLDPECRKEVREKIDVTDGELSRWEDISKKMRIVFEKDDIPAQFEGYESLKELDWEAYRKKYDDLHRLDRILKAEGDSPNKYKISKQADVLMLFYLFSADELSELFGRLGYTLEREKIPEFVQYYLDRTDHGSTLSRVVHSWVLARSDREHAWKLFVEALESDISDIQGGTTKEGIHLGAMAGTVELVQRCFTGLAIRDDILRLEPELPPNVKNLHFKVRYNCTWLDLSFNHREVKVKAGTGSCKPLKIGLNGSTFELQPDETKKIPL